MLIPFLFELNLPSSDFETRSKQRFWQVSGASPWCTTTLSFSDILSLFRLLIKRNERTKPARLKHTAVGACTSAIYCWKTELDK